jgi:hypothetical protein
MLHGLEQHDGPSNDAEGGEGLQQTTHHARRHQHSRSGQVRKPAEVAPAQTRHVATIGWQVDGMHLGATLKVIPPKLLSRASHALHAFVRQYMQLYRRT